MKQILLMPTGATGGLLLGLFLLAVPVAATAADLSAVLRDDPAATWEDVQAQARAIASNEEALRHGSTTESDSATFEGDYTPEEDARLAIFSDDGCSVTVDGAVVHGAKDQNQALPTLSESLHQVGGVLRAGQTYRIKVEYSNTKDTGNFDVDGATLFAYAAGTIPVSSVSLKRVSFAGTAAVLRDASTDHTSSGDRFGQAPYAAPHWSRS